MQYAKKDQLYYFVWGKITCLKLHKAPIAFDPFSLTAACNKYITEQLLTAVSKDCSRYLLTVLQPTNYSSAHCSLSLLTLLYRGAPLGSMKESFSFIMICQLRQKKLPMSLWTFCKVQAFCELLKVLRSATKLPGAALCESDHLLFSLWQVSIYFRTENCNVDKEKNLTEADAVGCYCYDCCCYYSHYHYY